MSHVVIVHYRARPGAEQKVADSLREMVRHTRAEPGNTAYHVARSPTDPVVFAIYEEYVDEAAMRAHTESAHFARWLREGTLPYLAERIRHDLAGLDPADHASPAGQPGAGRAVSRD
ncbi:putative quinol monooxygenase [Pseudofrankia saprophytica]|uniref:putative quinol monooxygenase n=1 Tax=Pseudofrankia saprophytica TaxID=298655 RepID=UPI000234C8B6|nr:putative quinol monooxygenase [Pseudofrankia saprophytica]